MPPKRAFGRVEKFSYAMKQFCVLLSISLFLIKLAGFYNITLTRMLTDRVVKNQPGFKITDAKILEGAPPPSK